MRILTHIPLKYRPLIFPSLILIIVVFLTLTLGRFTFNQIIEARENIKQLEEKNKALENKKNILSSLNTGELDRDVKTTVLAVPADNPSIFALSAIRGLALENGLSVSTFKVTEREEGKGKGRSVELTFDTSGSIFSTMSFLKIIQSSAPLIKITNVQFTVTGGSSLTRVTAVTFWGSLPTQLGQVDTPVQGLNDSERELLRKLGELKQPEISEVVPSQTGGKENPFAF